jgi:hypothetical protein
MSRNEWRPSKRFNTLAAIFGRSSRALASYRRIKVAATELRFAAWIAAAVNAIPSITATIRRRTWSEWARLSRAQQ